MISKALNFVW